MPLEHRKWLSSYIQMSRTTSSLTGTLRKYRDALVACFFFFWSMVLTIPRTSLSAPKLSCESPLQGHRRQLGPWAANQPSRGIITSQAAQCQSTPICIRSGPSETENERNCSLIGSKSWPQQPPMTGVRTTPSMSSLDVTVRCTRRISICQENIPR